MYSTTRLPLRKLQELTYSAANQQHTNFAPLHKWKWMSNHPPLLQHNPTAIQCAALVATIFDCSHSQSSVVASSVPFFCSAVRKSRASCLEMQSMVEMRAECATPYALSVS